MIRAGLAVLVVSFAIVAGVPVALTANQDVEAPQQLLSRTENLEAHLEAVDHQIEETDKDAVDDDEADPDAVDDDEADPDAVDEEEADPDAVDEEEADLDVVDEEEADLDAVDDFEEEDVDE